MTVKTDQLQLNRTGIWVPRERAEFEARVVYGEFSNSERCVEDLVHLSYVAHANFDSQVVKKFFNSSIEQHLTARNYFKGTIGSLGRRATTKTLVAMNMIVADLDEGTISGYLVEPFTDTEILPELYSVFGRNKVESIDWLTSLPSQPSQRR